MLYFNFLYSPDGGGYQNSASFLSSLVNLKYDFTNVCALVYKGTSIHEMCKRHGIQHRAIKKNVISKLLFELFSIRFVKKGDVVFSIFGPPMLLSKKYSLNVGGMAISNVLYPDIDFWAHLSFLKRMFKKVKDRYRVARYRSLDYFIFETELLREKAINQMGIPRKRTFVVNMSPSTLVSPEMIQASPAANLIAERKLSNKFLFLCGPHPNKRLHVLPDIALKLSSAGIDFKFILTCKSSPYLESVFCRAKSLGVSDYFLNVGSVKAEDVAGVIDVCDYLCCFSVLESFSNNFVEAWAMSKPLMVTDSDWSRSSCRDGAIYLDLSSLDVCVDQILSVISDSILIKRTIEKGREVLQEYPSSIRKAEEYLQVIDVARRSGKPQDASFL
ncbi:hypothetical protein KEHDKFFH_01445 [Marinobacter maroccanus]|uniref:Glycosyl transferase family 1 domain-containing protein n=1 Tax=Marinobacter maroccanus TaxID=2055143 RepID=A0A2S5ZF28_9GAMM|nr:glycosyltransferase family 4 protein [Marinobacter maroccanus]PPI86013.1 hypothetical protein KEHDKFFH_01445 [Marinobacter maroccanus]